MLMKRWKMGSWNGGADFKVIDRSEAMSELQNNLKANAEELARLQVRLKEMEAGGEKKEKELAEVSRERAVRYRNAPLHLPMLPPLSPTPINTIAATTATMATTAHS